jgi:maleamate amidohydrolase
VDKNDDMARNIAGVFDGRLNFGVAPALIIVDAVMAYFDETSPLFAGAPGVAASIARVLNAARTSAIPVIFTKVEYQPGGADGGLFYKKIPALKLFDAGSPLSNFPPELQPQDGEIIITKQYASAFFGTSLNEILAELNVDTVLIAGMSTSGCVRATALDALQYGYAPFVIRDACGDRHPQPHEASLFDLQAKYAEVIGEAEAIRVLNSFAVSVSD